MTRPRRLWRIRPRPGRVSAAAGEPRCPSSRWTPSVPYWSSRPSRQEHSGRTRSGWWTATSEGLLGEQIFPVAQGTSDDEPHLLALDAAGLPVVIEVTAELTEEALTAALNHAGRAGRLTRAELAARYTGGASRFQQDVAAFYDNVPLTRSQATARATGARLIVICSSAAPGIQDALDFLRQPGSPVAVLRLGVVHGADGRRFVDVSPLAMTRDNPAPPAAPEPRGAVPSPPVPTSRTASPWAEP